MKDRGILMLDAEAAFCGEWLRAVAAKLCGRLKKSAQKRLLLAGVDVPPKRFSGLTLLRFTNTPKATGFSATLGMSVSGGAAISLRFSGEAWEDLRLQAQTLIQEAVSAGGIWASFTDLPDAPAGLDVTLSFFEAARMESLMVRLAGLSRRDAELSLDINGYALPIKSDMRLYDALRGLDLYEHPPRCRWTPYHEALTGGPVCYVEYNEFGLSADSAAAAAEKVARCVGLFPF